MRYPRDKEVRDKALQADGMMNTKTWAFPLPPPIPRKTFIGMVASLGYQVAAKMAQAGRQKRQTQQDKQIQGKGQGRHSWHTGWARHIQGVRGQGYLG